MGAGWLLLRGGRWVPCGGGVGPRHVGVAGAGPLLLALVVGLCVGVPVVSYSPAPWWGQYHWRWGA